MPMTRRRLHTKSRKGCQECKRRKVKCDEVHPSCFNCSRYGVACSFETENKRPVVPTATAAASVSVAVAADLGFGPPKAPSPESAYDVLTPESQPPRPNISQLSDVFQSRPHNYVDVGGLVEPWRRDLELMHHYSTVTSSTFAYQEAAKLVWRDIFPQEGYTHEFIMHEVLSLAALHKAFLLPARRDAYLARSAYHHSVAQKTFAAQISDVTNENWRAVFCFATTVIADVLCQPSVSESTATAATTSISKTLELFSVTKGIRNTLLRFIPRLYETNLAPLGQSCWLVSVDPPPDPKPSLDYSPLPSDTFHAFACLRRILKDEEQLDNREDYDQAVWNLDVSAMQMAPAGVNIEFGAVLMWAFFLPDSITDDIKDLKPHALVILAHFAVLLNVLDKNYWFLRGWGKQLLDSIDEHLRDQPQYRKYLAWPRKNIVP